MSIVGSLCMWASTSKSPDGEAIRKHGLFYGWTLLTWVMIMMIFDLSSSFWLLACGVFNWHTQNHQNHCFKLGRQLVHMEEIIVLSTANCFRLNENSLQIMLIFLVYLTNKYMSISTTSVGTRVLFYFYLFISFFLLCFAVLFMSISQLDRPFKNTILELVFCPLICFEFLSFSLSWL